MKPYRTNGGLILLIAAVIMFSGISRADEKNTHYCIQIDNGSKTVMQCQNGTVTIVDNVGDKVVVCSTNPSETPRCQTLTFKDKR